MIQIDKEDSEESLVNFNLHCPNQKIHDLYREIFSLEYFKVLGIELPVKNQEGGGGEDIINANYQWWNRLVSFETDTLLKEYHEEPIEDLESKYENDTNLPVEEPVIWSIELSKQWGSPVLTEKEYKEMKKMSVRDDDLEQNDSGFIVQEIILLAENNNIQNERKKRVLDSFKEDLDSLKSLKYSQLPDFYILPMKQKYYIRISFNLDPRSMS